MVSYWPPALSNCIKQFLSAIWCIEVTRSLASAPGFVGCHHSDGKGTIRERAAVRRIFMNTNPTPYALGSEEGEALWFPGVLVTIKATAEQTGGEFFLIEELASRGTATPLHVHPRDDESFYILEGELTVYLDGQPIPASAG